VRPRNVTIVKSITVNGTPGAGYGSMTAGAGVNGGDHQHHGSGRREADRAARLARDQRRRWKDRAEDALRVAAQLPTPRIAPGCSRSPRTMTAWRCARRCGRRLRRRGGRRPRPRVGPAYRCAN
jgi:hypothetical protein